MFENRCCSVRNCKAAKRYYWLCHVSQFVRPHGKERVPLIRFSLNLLFDYFSNILNKIQLTLKRYKKNSHFTLKTVHIRHNAFLTSSQNMNCFRQKFFFLIRLLAIRESTRYIIPYKLMS